MVKFVDVRSSGRWSRRTFVFGQHTRQAVQEQGSKKSKNFLQHPGLLEEHVATF